MMIIIIMVIIGYPNPDHFTNEDAMRLLKKKLFGVIVSNKGVAEEDRWEKQILHIWVQNSNEALMLSKCYQALHPKLRSNTIIIITIAGNHKWIFS